MTNEQKQQLMRERATALLGDGTVSYAIGWRATRFPDKTAVMFMRDAGKAGELVWNEYTIPITAKYLTEDRQPEGKIAIFARGCDSKAINRLLADKQIRREDIYIIGLPCEGKSDDRCLGCKQKDPVVFDELLWAPDTTSALTPAPARSRFYRAEEIEALDIKSRFRYWENVYSQCIRCYACRNVCPVCTCRE